MLYRWNELDSVEQYAAYVRYSMLIVTFIPVVYAAGTADVELSNHASQTVLLAGPSIAIVGLMTWVVMTHPAFNLRIRPYAALAGKCLICAQGLTLFVALVGVVLTREHTWGYLAVLSASSIALLPWPLTKAMAPAALSAALITTWVSTFLGGPWLVGLGVVAFSFITAPTAWTVRLFLQAQRAREVEAELAIAEERLRFSQELHDTLGKHLAAMSVKAELVRALMTRGDNRAHDELAELQKLARRSSSEMHDVVKGHRHADLVTELEGARSLLQDAGTALSVNGDVSVIPASHHELAGWFVREAATNVVKHSNAKKATVFLSESMVEITNDGVEKEVDELGGLATLKQRARKNNADIVVEANGSTFSVRLEFAR